MRQTFQIGSVNYSKLPDATKGIGLNDLRHDLDHVDVGIEILRCSDRLRDRRALVDSPLTSPALFRGSRHRDWRDAIDEQGYSRYTRAYRQLTLQAMRPDWRLTSEGILQVHDAVCGGRETRSTPIRVGRYSDFVHPSGITEAISALVGRVEQETTPCAVKSALIHVGLVRIHPFADGNGRTARLISTMVLVNGGGRSTLTCSVEEMAGIFIGLYELLLRRFQEGVITEEAAVLGLLRMTDLNSKYADHFRRRERVLRELLATRLTLSPAEVNQALAEFDSGERWTGLGRAAARAVGSQVEPMRSWISRLPSAVRVAYGFQVSRLQEEQADDG